MTQTRSIAGGAPGPARDLPASLETIYLRLFPRLVGTAAGITGDRETGREVVQDAFAKLLSSDGPSDTASLEAWVWRSVLNRARDVRRRSWLADRVRRSGATAGEREAPEAAAGDPILRAAVLRLPVKQRTALFLRHYADMDYAAIAEVMGISEGTVGSTLNAAHRSLRSTLGEGS